MKISKVMVLGALMAIGFTGLAEEALLWVYDDPFIQTWSGSKKAADIVEQGKTINALRVVARVDGLDNYLTLYDASAGSSYEVIGQTMLLPSFDEDGNDSWSVAPTYAGLQDFAGKEGVEYLIELGNFTKVDGWTAIAFSETIDYAGLKDLYIMDMEDKDIPAVPWNGGAYTAVPEPSGGLLLMLGLSLLSLRRRQV